MTAGALLDSSSVEPLYHTINKGKLFFVEMIGVQRDHDRKYWYYKKKIPFLVIFA